jgi:hypothetical protein
MTLLPPYSGWSGIDALLQHYVASHPKDESSLSLNLKFCIKIAKVLNLLSQFTNLENAHLHFHEQYVDVLELWCYHILSTIDQSNFMEFHFSVQRENECVSCSFTFIKYLVIYM